MMRLTVALYFCCCCFCFCCYYCCCCCCFLFLFVCVCLSQLFVSLFIYLSLCVCVGCVSFCVSPLHFFAGQAKHCTVLYCLCYLFWKAACITNNSANAKAVCSSLPSPPLPFPPEQHEAIGSAGKPLTRIGESFHGPFHASRHYHALPPLILFY